MRRWICRRRGHRLDPDPGDFILHCTRCHTTVDLFDLIAAAMKEAP